MLCPKCSGTGYIECYSHVARGVCFACNGRGYVASNSKTIKSVKTTQLKHVLYGTTKQQTKLIVDMVLDGSWFTTWDSEIDKLVSLGYMVKTEHGIEPSPWFTPKSISILVDWSK